MLDRRAFLRGLLGSAVGAVITHHRPNHAGGPRPTPTPTPGGSVYTSVYLTTY